MSNDTTNQQVPQDGSIGIQQNAVKFGIIGGLGGIIVSLVLFFAHLEMESWSKWLQTLVMVAAILLGIKAIADDNKGKLIPFGTLFKGGMLITLIIAVISLVYFLVYSHFIDPNFVDKILEVSRQKMAEKGLSEEHMDMALEMTKKFMSPGIMTAIALISNLVVGAIISAIGAAIFKKE